LTKSPSCFSREQGSGSGSDLLAPTMGTVYVSAIKRFILAANSSFLE
jgi:hypothetical protein